MKLKKLPVLGLSLLAFALAPSLLSACKSDEPAQQGGYPAQTQPAGYNQAPAQPGYGQPTGVATAPAPVPTTPVAVTPAPAAAPLSTPGPLALPCTSDANCATHHCNTQFGKCVFPCLNDGDCIAPNRCLAGACLPSAQ